MTIIMMMMIDYDDNYADEYDDDEHDNDHDFDDKNNDDGLNVANLFFLEHL